MPPRERLDRLLVDRGLVASRQQAQRAIRAGQVRVAGRIVDKPGHPVPVDADIQLQELPRYVSRGGLKLEAALDSFGLDVRGRVAVDVGASTGGFTDCLLQRGVARVYAVDVGYGQLAWKLRQDPRVVVLERTNIRHLEELPEGSLADLAVVDTSFIGLERVLPATVRLLQPQADLIVLVKPQFEAGPDKVGKGGVVRDPRIHREVLERVIAHAQELGLEVAGLRASPLLGPAGNVEFLLWLRRRGRADRTLDIQAALAQALSQAWELVRSKRRSPRDVP